MKRVIILGAGISGLACAWFCQELLGEQVRITVIEQSDQVGGWIKTARKNGFLFEQGPHSCRIQQENSAILRLIAGLSLQDQILLPTSIACKRYILLNKQLTLFPTSFFELIKSPFLLPLLKAFWRDWRAPISADSDESIYSFASRRFGQKVTEQLIDPLVTGIYAGDMRHLSVQACFPLLRQLEQEYGSVVRGYFSQKRAKPKCERSFLQQEMKGHSCFSFKNGMATLPHTLAKKLKADILLSSRVTSLSMHSHGVDVVTTDGKSRSADFVISALPAHQLLSLFGTQHTTLGALLTTMESASTVVVNLGYNHAVLRKEGFGYLIPSAEGESILGMIWDSSVFPQQDDNLQKTRLAVILGGARQPSIWSQPEEDLIQSAQDAVKRYMKIETLADVTLVSRAHCAIPQYHVGHVARLNHLYSILEKQFPRLFCIGSSFKGVSINDCIANAEEAALQLKARMTSNVNVHLGEHLLSNKEI